MTEKKNNLSEYFAGERDCSARVMRAALEEFALRTMDGARTREIAKRANVNHAAISYYFGGKENLYNELVREISSFIRDFAKPYIEKAKKIVEKKDAAAAKKLLLDFYMSKIPLNTSDRETSGYVSMLISREEIFPTKAFETFYKTFREINKMCESMIEVGSKGKISGVEAKLVSGMLLLQMKLFKSSNTGLMRNNGWREIGEKELVQIKKFQKNMLDKILK